MSTTLILVLGVGCVCVMAVAALVLLIILNSGGNDDPYKDLPTSPPRTHPWLQRYLEQMWASKSDCWHFNHWVRVTVTNAMVKFYNDTRGDMFEKDFRSKPAFIDMMARFAYPIVQRAHIDLNKCGPTATFIDHVTGKPVLIKDVAGQFKYGALTYPEFRAMVERGIRGTA